MKILYFILSIFMLYPSLLISQIVEVEGKIKVTSMASDNSVDLIVVKQANGTLAVREASSIADADSDPTNEIELPENPNVGDVIYFDGTSWVILAPGSDGQHLELKNGLPTWKDPSCNLHIGQFYQGGYIFYIDSTGCHGYVAAIEDQSSGAEWGCFGLEIGVTEPFLGTGQNNTDAINFFCTEAGIAAKLCEDYIYNGFDDWFLPSIEALDLMFRNLADLDGNHENDGPSDPYNIGGFSASEYWSSFEQQNTTAAFYNFSNQTENSTGKDFSFSVRAIRAF